MKLKIRNGVIYNEEGHAIGSLSDNATEEEERAIELGSEAVPVIEQFISDVNSGSLKPRAAVKAFETIIEKHKI